MPGRRSRAWFVTCTAIVMIAQVFATQSGTASLRGVVFDPTNRLMPQTTLVLTNMDGRARRRETKSDGAGGYSFTDLAPGTYALEAQRQGFVSLRSELRLTGAVEQNFRLTVGQLTETITVEPRSADPRPPPNLQDDARQRARVRDHDEAAKKPCAAGPLGRVGGFLVAPVKVAHVTPDYPAELRGLTRETVVELRATIGVEGLVRDIVPVNDADPAVVAITTGAVQQWRFLPAVLNCEPIAVAMRVITAYVPRP